MSATHAELCCLSAFSFQRGASIPEELVARAAALGYEAIALTDEASLAGAVRALQTAEKTGAGGRREVGDRGRTAVGHRPTGGECGRATAGFGGHGRRAAAGFGGRHAAALHATVLTNLR